MEQQQITIFFLFNDPKAMVLICIFVSQIVEIIPLVLLAGNDVFLIVTMGTQLRIYELYKDLPKYLRNEKDNYWL